MTVLLLGKNGQVGTELRRTLASFDNLIALGREELDLEQLPALEHLLSLYKPSIIVNAAAYTAVDRAESEPERAFLINREVVAVLAQFAYANNALLIHYSTDYVFDGKQTRAYVETDEVNPQNTYGITKRAGEEAIFESGCRYFIFRTSWVYSVTGNNFVKTMLSLAKTKSHIRVVADQQGTPTSAAFIAEITAQVIAQSTRYGVYHLTASGQTTWHELACYVVDSAKKHGITQRLTSDCIQPITSSEYPLPARRPNNSTLNIHALSKELAIDIEPWRHYVEDTIKQLAHMESVL